MSDLVEVSQGRSVKRRKRKVVLVPEEKPKSKAKIEPYVDPNATPKLNYCYRKIHIPADQTSSKDVDEILNSCASIVRWDEKVLNDGSIIITIIYSERPKKKTIDGEEVL
ncbi:MAG: hypothetical protein QXQ43_04520 [Nitrososphaerota archaeon]